MEVFYKELKFSLSLSRPTRRTVLRERSTYRPGARYYDPRLSQFYGVDPLAYKYPNISPFTYTADNPVMLVDPDGRKVIPTNELKANSDLYFIFRLAMKNSAFQTIMEPFISNQNHVYIHLDHIRNSSGKPTPFTNTARAEAWAYDHNPVGKYGIHRIVINSSILSGDGKLRMDKTFIFRALLHEGIHVLIFERMKQNNLSDYPGHLDFLRRGGEWQHNQMAAYYRQFLIRGMKEFDNQLKLAGQKVPEYHTDQWYEAMSWYGLRRTQAWEDFKRNNPEKAKQIDILIKEQIKRNQKAIVE